jgi:dienelactone hydrolase
MEKLMTKLITRVLLSICALLLAAACVAPPVLVTPSPVETPPRAAQPSETSLPDALPAAVEYNLGEATVVQERFPEGSPFRDMPVRLNGLIAAPAEGDGPFPVVVIIHGTHPGCPEVEHGVDRWPCDPAVEQRNYSGFAYLVEALAARGYVALAPNFNAEHTFGFGEPIAGERLEQLIALHLQGLAEAVSDGENRFGAGVDLAGRADLGRLALLGHSRGGDAAFALANDPDIQSGDSGFGPIDGVLLVAAAGSNVDPWTSVGAPMAAIQAACDGDVTSQSGQAYFEGPRLAPDQSAWATSAWLEGANHNAFNTILPGDMVVHRDRPDCETLLDGEAQRAWLIDYAGDFLATLFAEDAATVDEAKARLGINVTTPAPDELYGLPARVAFLAPAADRQTVMIPADPEELATHRLGGEITAEDLPTHFCPKGFYSAWMLPGSEPCRRNYVTVPGQPAHAVVWWEAPGAALRFALPEGAGDLSGYTTLSLRAAVDPASPLNAAGSRQALSVQLTDRAGNSAVVQTRPDEPALGFPPGLMQDDDAPGTGFFTGRVPLTTIRMPLSGFAGVDLSAVAEIALLFDLTPSGTLFLGDVEGVRPSQP